MAQLAREPYPGPWNNGVIGPDWKAQWEAESAKLEALRQVSNELPDDQVLGGVIRFQIADGYAWYVVTKEKPLTLAWIPIGDAWQIDAALIRGLRRADVLTRIERERALSRMFGKSKFAKRTS